MITLAFLAYVFISLLISFRRMQDDYTLFGDFIKAKKPKEAFIEGFSALPVMALILAVGCGTLWLASKILFGTIGWILHNMP